ncbi:MAG: phosphotransferase family protein [Myxococcota bacterium]|nr:phosphotransferase family protein [Myxococcota bacterium]
MTANRTVAVRDSEALDLDALRLYLEGSGMVLSGALQQSQFPSGYSNLSYLIQDEENAWVLRRPPVGASAKGGHDMGREYQILSALHPTYHKVPEPYLYCDDETVLGSPFYLMEKVEGIIIRKQLPATLSTAEALCDFSGQLVDALGEIHGVNVDAAGLSGLGRPEGYVRRQIEGWAKRYIAAQTEQIPRMFNIAEWLASHMPTEAGATLIHNDYKIDNVVLSPETADLVAVLDWEMATLGCPLMDLGASLGYWVDANDPQPMRLLPVGPTHEKGYISRQLAVARYEQATGRTVNDPVFYYVYGLWRIAVILQQIYMRYVFGYTTDHRFANLIHGVHILSIQAEKAIAKERYWDLA